MKHQTNRCLPFTSPLICLFFAACAVAPKSDVDTPEYHFRAGMRAVESINYDAALVSFGRSVALEPKFAAGYAGLAVAEAHLNRVEEARGHIGKAASKGKKDPDVLALCSRATILLRNSDRKWFKHATGLLDRALKRSKNHEAALYYYGEAHTYHHDFMEAESYFSRVVEQRGEFSGKADRMWQTVQKIGRAKPGTPEGTKVALQEKITRADLAVLLVEELKVSELIARMPASASGFQTPGQQQAVQAGAPPPDVAGHWAATWIGEVLQYGILEPIQGTNFSPEETVNRAEYAMAIQRLLVLATRDASLETRYFGETPSRFGDVYSSHPAYNAMALCTERGIMQADVITGNFGPSGSVSGADALLIIRGLQNALRTTF